MNVTTVSYANRTHYAHTENRRTLCGLVGGVDITGAAAECGRCLQIFHGVDTSVGPSRARAS